MRYAINFVILVLIAVQMVVGGCSIPDPDDRAAMVREVDAVRMKAARGDSDAADVVEKMVAWTRLTGLDGRMCSEDHLDMMAMDIYCGNGSDFDAEYGEATDPYPTGESPVPPNDPFPSTLVSMNEICECVLSSKDPSSSVFMYLFSECVHHVGDKAANLVNAWFARNGGTQYAGYVCEARHTPAFKQLWEKNLSRFISSEEIVDAVLESKNKPPFDIKLKFFPLIASTLCAQSKYGCPDGMTPSSPTGGDSP